MRKILLYIFCILCFSEAKTQIYFSERFDHIDPNLEMGMGIIADSGIYYVQYAFRETGFATGFGFLKLDSLGNQLTDKNYRIPGYFYGSGLGGSFVKTLYGSLIAVGNIQDSSSRNTAYCIGYNKQGDTLFTRRFGDTVNNHIFYAVTSTKDSGFVCVGGLTDITTAYNLIVKYDKFGIQEWFYTYPGSSASIKELSSGNFLVGGVRYNDCGGQQHGLIKISSSGSFIWKKCYSASFWEGSLHVSDELSDGAIYLSGGRNHSSGIYFKAYLAKADTNGIITWEREYGAAGSTSGFGEAFITPDDNIIIFEQINGYTNIYKLMPNGDSIWRRTIQYNNNYNNFSALSDIEVLNNNEIIAVGMVNPSFPDTGDQDVWVIKLDEWGCDTLGCQYTAINENNDEHGSISIYPNPSSDYACLEYDGEEGDSKLTIELFSIEGKIVYSQSANASKKMFFIPLTDIPSGTYFVKASKNNEVLGTKKLVVVK